MFIKKLFNSKRKYVIEFVEGQCINGPALFRNNPIYDKRGKYYRIEDYVWSRAGIFMMDGECILFVRDNKHPKMIKASNDAQAVNKYNKYRERLNKIIQSVTSSSCCGL